MSEVTAVPEAPDSGDIGSDLAASWDAQEPPSSESSAPAAPATSETERVIADKVGLTKEETERLGKMAISGIMRFHLLYDRSVIT